jgi:hypothetical protein
VRPGNHAAGDGSFGRSAGTHAGKALALVAVAVLIGVLLLHRNGPGSVNVAVTRQPTTTAKSPSATRPSTGGATTLPSATTTLPTRAPQDVKVLVANGTSVAKQAARYSDKLHSLGYDTLATTDTTVKVPASVVYFVAGFQQDAVVLAAHLGLAATTVQPMPAAGHIPVTNLNGANILLAVGPDLANAPGSPPAATTPAITPTTRRVVTTTTTAHPATTTTTVHH